MPTHIRSFLDYSQVFLSSRARQLGYHAGAGALNVDAAVQDVLSPLLSILSPPLRPVNFGLLNSREKADTKSLIQTMAANGITFVAKAANAAAGLAAVPKWRQLQRAEDEHVFSLQP
jgi:hypothetical protein